MTPAETALANELCRLRHNHGGTYCHTSSEEAKALTVLDEERRRSTPNTKECSVCLNGRALRDAAELEARWDAAEHGPTMDDEAIPPPRNKWKTVKCTECDQWYMFWYAATKETTT